MSESENKILRNEDLDNDLLHEGYVVTSFLSPEQITHLKKFFESHHPQKLEGFYASAHTADTDFRKKMNDEIKSVFSAPIERTFINCTPLGGSFVVKANKNSDILQPHQDWNIVDEENYRSFNIWVPLVDLTEENGAIMVLPKSHRWLKNFRGPNIPDQFDDKKEQLLKKMRTLKMKAGEALIYDHRLFHSSHANTSNQLRIAAVFGIIPKAAEMFYYFGKEDKVEVYKSSVDFFMEGNIQKGPEILEKVKEVNNKEIVFNNKQLHDEAFSLSFMDKIRSFF